MTERQVTEPISPTQVMDAYTRFDMSDITGARVGVEVTTDMGNGCTLTTTRFGHAGKLSVVDGVLCVSVVFDGEPAADVPVSAVNYVDGKCVLP